MSLIGLSPSPSQSNSNSSHIIDSDQNRFAEDVIKASMTVPVIVDFWAPWCGPCKTLGPLLEKTVNNANGKVKLVKINADENQALIQQMRIQSLPTVYAFFQGQPVDGFAGAQPETEIKTFITKLIAIVDGGAQQGLDDASIEDIQQNIDTLLQNGQTQDALSLGEQIFEMAPNNAKAAALLTKTYISTGHQEKAQGFLDTLSQDMRQSPEIKSLENTLALAEAAASAGDPDLLLDRLNASPEDHETAIQLATAYAGRGFNQKAVDVLMASIKQNPEWNDKAARQKLFTLFEAFGPQDPATIAGRRQLSAMLFS